MFFEIILKLFKKISFCLAFNIVLVFSYFFFEIVLEEDIIIGCFSMFVLISLFLLLKESKSETLRQLRLRSKLVFRIQKIVLKNYSFFYSSLSKIHFRFFKKVIYKMILIKFYKFAFKLNVRNIYSRTCVIFLKVYNFNLLILLILVSLVNFYKGI